MSNIDKQALRKAAEKAGADEWCAFIDTKSKTYSVHTPGDNRCGDVVKWAGFDGQQRAAAKAKFIASANPATVLALLDELEAEQRISSTWRKTSESNREKLEAAEKRIAGLTEALRQTVIGYKSCLRTGHDRILDLGGDCDALEVMIAGNPDIQQAEKLLAAGTGKGE